MMLRILALVALLHVGTLSAQATTSGAVADSAKLEKVRAFAVRLRALLDSQNVAGVALMAAPTAAPHRGEPLLFRFLGPAQIVSPAGTRVVGAASGLSVMVVSPEVWLLTGVDAGSPYATVADDRRRAWTALVNIRDSLPRLLYLHVSPPK